MHNNTSKLNLFFGYDALGHRTYKNQIKYTDTGRIEQSTFYVREASGNILAEYETMRQYSKGGIKDALKDIRGAVSAASAADVKHRWSMALDQLGYTTDDKFSAAIIAATGVHGTTRSTGYYLANDAGLTQQFVLGSPDVMPAMAAYSAALNKYPVANALRMDLAAGDADIKLNNLSTALLGNPDTALQEHALLQLAETLPDIYAQVAQDNQLVISSSIDSIQLFNAMKYIANNNPAYFATQMFNAYQMEPTVIDNWLNAISSDTLYTNNTYYQANGFVGALQNSLLQFADDAATEEAMRSTGDPADKERFGLYGFGSWWPAGKSLLTSLSNSLDKVEYANDPIAVLDALPTYDVVDDAMEQLRDVDVEALADRMGVDYTAIAVSGTLTAPSLLQQSIALSSHHMYGSSRLGITRYWPTQYRHYWNYQSGIIDTLRLGMPSAWYSSALNDIIEAGHADPANLSANTYNGVAHSMFAQHLLGQKQYELTNHLGNVQATLSDKRYVKTLSGNGTTATRDYFNAAIVAAYDYYPYGMLMPGRWTSDTDAHCSTLTLSQLVPHKTNTDLLGGTVLSPSFSLIHGATALTAATGLGTTAGYTVYGKGGGVSKTFTVASGVPIAINISIPYIYGSFITISVRETKAGVTSVLNTKNVTAAASYVLNVTPTTGTISIVVETMSSFAAAPSGGLFTLGYVGYEQVNYVPENVLVNLCSDNKDKYEFGYNTQMKVNEIAGIGNWNTAEFWEYNTRTGVRANIDPVFVPWESSYSVNHSNPIVQSDPNGDYSKGAAWALNILRGGNGIAQDKRTGEWGFGYKLHNGKQAWDYGVPQKKASGNRAATANNKPDFLKVLKGMWDEFGKTNDAMHYILHNPIDAASGAVDAISHPINTLSAINNQFEANMGSSEGRGRNLWFAATFLTFVKFAPAEEVVLREASFAAKGGIQLESSVAKVMGNSYKAMGEVTVPIKNTELLNYLNATSKGNWVKVYEAGMQNGAKIETHYFRNRTTGQVFDVKTKYNYWHQKAFKNLGQ